MKRSIAWQIATIKAIKQETHNVKTYTLALPDWTPHRAGQHYDLRLTAPDGYQAQRSYSIASEPERTGEIDLTVEQLDNGEVSSYMNEVLVVGDQIEVRGPIGGYFVWQVGMGGPLLLVAGGSGIVPLMAMIRHRSAAGACHSGDTAGPNNVKIPTRLLYSSRSPEDVIYFEELMRLRRLLREGRAGLVVRRRGGVDGAACVGSAARCRGGVSPPAPTGTSGAVAARTWSQTRCSPPAASDPARARALLSLRLPCLGVAAGRLCRRPPRLPRRRRGAPSPAALVGSAPCGAPLWAPGAAAGSSPGAPFFGVPRAQLLPLPRLRRRQPMVPGDGEALEASHRRLDLRPLGDQVDQFLWPGGPVAAAADGEAQAGSSFHRRRDDAPGVVLQIQPAGALGGHALADRMLWSL